MDAVTDVVNDAGNWFEGVCCELMRAMDYWLSEACKPGKSPRE